VGDSRALDTRLLWAVTAAGLVATLYLRLVPFDVNFDSGVAAIAARFTWQPLSIRDIPLNLLIFIPFSFGLSGLLYQGGRAWPRVMSLTVLTVLLLSLAIELLQVYIPERVPSVIDILINGLSAVLGVLLYRLAVFGVRRAIVRYASPVTVVAGLTIYAGFVALFTTYLLWSAGLSNWNDRYPLNLGNEASDLRPWMGEIGEVVLLGRAVSPAEAGDLLAGRLPADSLAYYDLNDGTLTDVQSVLPPLVWRPAVPEQPIGDLGVTVGSEQWLTTGAPVAAFSAVARDGGEGFSVAGVFRAGQTRQRGPARIISVSADATHRNITLGQQGQDFVIRLRTPSAGTNGEKPAMVIPGLFASLAAHRVVMSFDPPRMDVWVDEVDRHYAVSLAPGLALFQGFERSQQLPLPFPANPRLYDYRYWALMLIPALLAAAILIGIRDAAIGRMIVPPVVEPRD
jgi:glycopeptide antibiotics resistance protein